MPTQRLVHAVPLQILPRERVSFSRASLVPGVSMQQFSGPMARAINLRDKLFQIQPNFLPTHVLVVDQTAYLNSLDARLAKEGITREKREPEFVDIRGISRQVLIAISLVGRAPWQVGGTHSFDHSDSDFPYSSAGYRPSPPTGVSDFLRYGAPDGWFVDISASKLRTTASRLDRYYRTGSWWQDRLGVALGYLWSALTTSHPELAFAALCMALEAIATSGDKEITHSLAERCALLARTTIREREEMYVEVKSLYGLRSKIVHGRSGPRRGPLTSETLAITAKQSHVPRSKVFRLLAIVIDVINEVLRSPSLLQILRTRQNDDNEGKAIDAFFLRLLLQ
jgi:hypothetical protein